MPWPIIIGSAAVCVWLANSIVQIVDIQREAKERNENGQLRLLYSLLRLLEASPSGLISTELKLVLCKFISVTFRQLQNIHGQEAGYQACIDTAEAQIDILERRTPTPLPTFNSLDRIHEGQQALPRLQKMVIELRQQNFLSAEKTKYFCQQINDRHKELEADSSLLRAKTAQQYNDSFSASRHLQSARLTTQKIKNVALKDQRIAQIDNSLQNLTTKLSSPG